jgi:hypothetical protein
MVLADAAEDELTTWPLAEHDRAARQQLIQVFHPALFA